MNADLRIHKKWLGTQVSITNSTDHSKLSMIFNQRVLMHFVFRLKKKKKYKIALCNY